MKKIVIALCFVALFASFAFGQTILTTTTLSAAVSSSSSQTFGLTSATNVNAPSASDTTKLTFLYVDRELVQVVSVSGTSARVIRGLQGTAATTHASGAIVFVIPAYLSASQGGPYGIAQGAPSGSCTRANEVSLPRINYVSGIISDCNGGQWVNGDALSTTRSLAVFQNPATGGTLYTALETAGTAAGATTEMYCTQIRLPYSMYATGLKILNGTTVATDKHNVELYDAGGKLLANSAAAGAVTAGASTYQSYAFTSPYYMVGPATYFGCFTANGTTDTVRHLVTAADQGLLAGKITGLTFGTIPASITVPSSFTTALGAYLEVY
jgi:hypothetical protein